VAPILWRLPAIDISLPEKQTKSMQRYMNDMFSREAFIDSLTESELEMRE
jgi:RNA polymerase-associated protein